jgi:hypothetical protein
VEVWSRCGGPWQRPEQAGDREAELRNDLDDAVRRWRDDGWVLIDGLVDAATMATVAEELAVLAVPRATGPTRRADQADRPRFRAAQFDGTHLFPLPGAPVTNRLVVNPDLVDFAARAIGRTDLRIYQSRLWSKYGDHADYAQPLHRDLNHSLVPGRAEPGWWHLECFLYLSEVGADTGAPRLVPRSSLAGLDLPDPDDRRPVERDDHPALYDREVAAPGPPGSLLAYRSDVWHRGVDIAPGRERHVLVVAFKAAGADWIGFDAHPPLVTNPDFVAFAEACGPEELALFGIPRPGHPFWTDETVDAMAGIYPGLDLDPWRRGLRRSG